MKWTSALAIYCLSWVMSAFLVLPFGVRTADEMGVEKVPGQAESAPANFNPKKVMIKTTILAAILFGLYYLNYTQGWIGVDDLDFFTPPSAE